MRALRILVAVAAVTIRPGVAAAPEPVPDRLPPPIALLDPPVVAAPRPVVRDIAAFVRRVNESVPPARAEALAIAIVAASEARGLDPRILTGIIAHESHFHADVQACHARGCDLGVGQVHWETWGQELKLDRRRLVHDDAYNVGVAADILADLRRRFAAEGPRWWTRYHDRRPDRRAQYADLVLAHGADQLAGL